MRPGAVSPRQSVEDRAGRFQRRYTGPWRIRPVIGDVVVRYRRRRLIEYVRLAVAWRDLERAFWRGALPVVRLPRPRHTRPRR